VGEYGNLLRISNIRIKKNPRSCYRGSCYRYLCCPLPIHPKVPGPPPLAWAPLGYDQFGFQAGLLGYDEFGFQAWGLGELPPSSCVGVGARDRAALMGDPSHQTPQWCGLPLIASLRQGSVCAPSRCTLAQWSWPTGLAQGSWAAGAREEGPHLLDDVGLPCPATSPTAQRVPPFLPP